VHGEREILAGGQVNVGSLLLLEARPAAGESDAEIVAGAWDFAHINRRYSHHLKVLDQCPSDSLRDIAAARVLQHWAVNEREAWLAAVRLDPLLPERLLPPDYLGRQAWQRRKDVLGLTGERLRTFGWGT